MQYLAYFPRYLIQLFQTSPSLAIATTWGSSVLLFLVSSHAFYFSVELQLHPQLWEETGGWLSKKADYGLLHVCPDSFVRTEVTVTPADEGAAEILIKCWWSSGLYHIPLCSLLLKAFPLALKSVLHGNALRSVTGIFTYSGIWHLEETRREGIIGEEPFSEINTLQVVLVAFVMCCLMVPCGSQCFIHMRSTVVRNMCRQTEFLSPVMTPPQILVAVF